MLKLFLLSIDTAGIAVVVGMITTITDSFPNPTDVRALTYSNQ